MRYATGYALVLLGSASLLASLMVGMRAGECCIVAGLAAYVVAGRVVVAGLAAEGQ